MNFSLILIGIWAIINLVSFILMGSDKRSSLQGREVQRIPEGILFFWATAGGSVGIYLGIFAFRHKTQKWYFQIGIPLLILQNAAVVFVLWELL